MRVLITGGKGFLGTVLSRSLTSHKVFQYDITDGYDILDTVQLRHVFDEFQPEAVIHLAACADLNKFVGNTDLNNKLNIEGTRNLLAQCERVYCRMLFASTCCCYGNTPVHPSIESCELFPTEPYAMSKAKSEKDVLASTLPHCCMRLATFYGPEMRKELAPAIFISAAAANQPIFIHGDGLQTRTMTYVDDVASGIVTILESNERPSIVNVTTEEITSVNDMATIAMRVVGQQVNIKHVEDRSGQIYKEYISSALLQSMGWLPRVTFEEGMQRSFEYYNKNGTW